MNVCKFSYKGPKSNACYFIIQLNNSPDIWKTNRPGIVIKTSSLYVPKGMKIYCLYSSNPKTLVFSLQAAICPEHPHCVSFYAGTLITSSALQKQLKPKFLASNIQNLSDLLGKFQTKYTLIYVIWVCYKLVSNKISHSS